MSSYFWNISFFNKIFDIAIDIVFWSSYFPIVYSRSYFLDILGILRVLFLVIMLKF